MKLLDANLLLYAYDELSSRHDSARAWLEETFSGTEVVAFAWQTLHAFLRISTNARVYERPLSVEEAVGLLEGWLALPPVRVLQGGVRYWPIFRRLLVAGDVRRDLVMDAHLAALAIEHDATLYSCDSDFGRFPALRWIDPLART